MGPLITCPRYRKYYHPSPRLSPAQGSGHAHHRRHTHTQTLSQAFKLKRTELFISEGMITQGAEANNEDGDDLAGLKCNTLALDTGGSLVRLAWPADSKTLSRPTFYLALRLAEMVNN